MQIKVLLLLLLKKILQIKLGCLKQFEKQTNQVEFCPLLHHRSSIYLPCHRQSPLAAHASLFWLTTSTTPPVVKKITVTMVTSHVTQNITFDNMVRFIKYNLPNKPYQYFSRILYYGMPWILIIQSRGGNLKETYNSHRYLFQTTLTFLHSVDKIRNTCTL